MNRTILALASAALTAATGCEIENDIDYETIYAGNQLILNGYISEADGVLATIKKTVPPNTPMADNKIDDATLLLIEDGAVVDTLTTQDNIAYTLKNDNRRIAPAHRYAIKAVSASLGTAQSAEVALPQPVDIVSTELDSSSFAFVIAFDNPSTDYAYNLKVWTYKDGNEDVGLFGRKLSWTFTSDMPQGHCTMKTTGLSREMKYNKCDSINIRLIVLSPEFKEYFKSYSDYIDTRNEVYYDMPYPVGSNVSGGLGFVGSYAVSNVIVKNNIGDDTGE